MKAINHPFQTFILHLYVTSPYYERGKAFEHCIHSCRMKVRVVDVHKGSLHWEFISSGVDDIEFKQDSDARDQNIPPFQSLFSSAINQESQLQRLCSVNKSMFCIYP